jgi:hypothetical protein
MNNRIPLTTAALALSCIRLLAILVSSLGMLLPTDSLIGRFFNVVYYASSIMHVAVVLYLAYALSLIKENVSTSLAYMVYAFMSATFLLLGFLGIHNVKTLSTVSAINLIVILFFAVQSFLINNQFFKNAFRVYGGVTLLLIVFNMVVPYIAYTLALPMNTLRLTSFLYILPASVEIYIVYLFYRYFNSAMSYDNNDFTGNL